MLEPGCWRVPVALKNPWRKKNNPISKGNSWAKSVAEGVKLNSSLTAQLWPRLSCKAGLSAGSLMNMLLLQTCLPEDPRSQGLQLRTDRNTTSSCGWTRVKASRNAEWRFSYQLLCLEALSSKLSITTATGGQGIKWPAEGVRHQTQWRFEDQSWLSDLCLRVYKMAKLLPKCVTQLQATANEQLFLLRYALPERRLPRWQQEMERVWMLNMEILSTALEVSGFADDLKHLKNY